ncbi:MAG: energy transducer TonB [Candidatus Eisenbacteria sp.]|nr:energy transducer TonB [Candidatus Eisenbacteria bacterium]
MFAPDWYESAHEKLKQRYTLYMFYGALGAVVMTGLGAAFSPPYIPTPYQLRERTAVSVELPDEIVIPAPPADVARPEIARAFEESDEADATVTIAPTDFNPFAPPEIPQAPPAPEEFVAYDSPPKLIHAEQPDYPELAMQGEAEGKVDVVVTIDENGRVIDVYIASSTANEVLQRAALEAARKFLFRPARQRDVPVKCRIMIPFNFGLN